jgi:glycosyltransferase involved in cell wall biosynthesis
MPRVSVVIPAYNTAPFISESLDSVLDQKFGDFEVIVINDGSPDTAELESALQPYTTRIQYIKQENRGAPGARNTGIRSARGEFLAFLDSDDIWLPDYLETQVRFLDERPGVVASIADAVLFGNQDEVVWKMVKTGTPAVLTFDRMLKREGGQIPSATVARRMEVLRAGGFDEELPRAEDMELCLRICFPDRAIGYPGKVLVKYRQRSGSLTSDPRKWNAAEIVGLRRLGQKLKLSAAQRAVLCEEIAAGEAALALSDAQNYLASQKVAECVRHLRLANAYYRDPRITMALAGLRIFPRWSARILTRRWRKAEPHRALRVLAVQSRR